MDRHKKKETTVVELQKKNDDEKITTTKDEENDESSGSMKQPQQPQQQQQQPEIWYNNNDHQQYTFDINDDDDDDIHNATTIDFVPQQHDKMKKHSSSSSFNKTEIVRITTPNKTTTTTTKSEQQEFSVEAEVEYNNSDNHYDENDNDNDDAISSCSTLTQSVMIQPQDIIMKGGGGGDSYGNFSIYSGSISDSTLSPGGGEYRTKQQQILLLRRPQPSESPTPMPFVTSSSSLQQQKLLNNSPGSVGFESKSHYRRPQPAESPPTVPLKTPPRHHHQTVVVRKTATSNATTCLTPPLFTKSQQQQQQPSDVAKDTITSSHHSNKGMKQSSSSFKTPNNKNHRGSVEVVDEKSSLRFSVLSSSSGLLSLGSNHSTSSIGSPGIMMNKEIVQQMKSLDEMLTRESLFSPPREGTTNIIDTTKNTNPNTNHHHLYAPIKADKEDDDLAFELEALGRAEELIRQELQIFDNLDHHHHNKRTATTQQQKFLEKFSFDGIDNNNNNNNNNSRIHRNDGTNNILTKHHGVKQQQQQPSVVPYNQKQNNIGQSVSLLLSSLTPRRLLDDSSETIHFSNDNNSNSNNNQNGSDHHRFDDSSLSYDDGEEEGSSSDYHFDRVNSTITPKISNRKGQYHNNPNNDDNDNNNNDEQQQQIVVLDNDTLMITPLSNMKHNTNVTLLRGSMIDRANVAPEQYKNDHDDSMLTVPSLLLSMNQIGEETTTNNNNMTAVDCSSSIVTTKVLGSYRYVTRSEGEEIRDRSTTTTTQQQLTISSGYQVESDDNDKRRTQDDNFILKTSATIPLKETTVVSDLNDALSSSQEEVIYFQTPDFGCSSSTSSVDAASDIEDNEFEKIPIHIIPLKRISTFGDNKPNDHKDNTAIIKTMKFSTEPKEGVIISHDDDEHPSRKRFVHEMISNNNDFSHDNNNEMEFEYKQQHGYPENNKLILDTMDNNNQSSTKIRKYNKRQRERTLDDHYLVSVQSLLSDTDENLQMVESSDSYQQTVEIFDGDSTTTSTDSQILLDRSHSLGNQMKSEANHTIMDTTTSHKPKKETLHNNFDSSSVVILEKNKLTPPPPPPRLRHKQKNMSTSSLLDEVQKLSGIGSSFDDLDFFSDIQRRDANVVTLLSTTHEKRIDDNLASSSSPSVTHGSNEKGSTDDTYVTPILKESNNQKHNHEIYCTPPPSSSLPTPKRLLVRSLSATSQPSVIESSPTVSLSRRFSMPPRSFPKFGTIPKSDSKVSIESLFGSVKSDVTSDSCSDFVVQTNLYEMETSNTLDTSDVKNDSTEQQGGATPLSLFATHSFFFHEDKAKELATPKQQQQKTSHIANVSPITMSGNSRYLEFSTHQATVDDANDAYIPVVPDSISFPGIEDSNLQLEETPKEITKNKESVSTTASLVFHLSSSDDDERETTLNQFAHTTSSSSSMSRESQTQESLPDLETQCDTELSKEEYTKVPSIANCEVLSISKESLTDSADSVGVGINKNRRSKTTSLILPIPTTVRHRRSCCHIGLFCLVLILIPCIIVLITGLSRRQKDGAVSAVTDLTQVPSISPSLMWNHGKSDSPSEVFEVTPTLPPSRTPLSSPSALSPLVIPYFPSASDLLEDDLFRFLVESSTDSGLALLSLNGSIPQYQAYEWLSRNRFLSSYSPQQIKQRYALATLYYSTDGDNWRSNDLWLSNEDECTWYTRQVDPGICGPNETTNNTIINLDLYYNNLGGTIPAEIALLSNSLTSINFSGGPSRSMHGTIPFDISRLTRLTEVWLQNSMFSGSIQNIFSQLSMLRVLSLNDNRFNGTIPTEVGKLSSLSQISLQNNKLEGTIPVEIGHLSSLRQLALGNNSLVSTIPPGIGNLTGLFYLQLSNNALSGTIVSEIGNLRLLRTIDFSQNKFGGQLPTELGLLSKLRTLDLSDNLFTGSIPSNILSESNRLTSFELHGNMLLSGSIPVSFQNLTLIKFLSLYETNITGTMPNVVCTTFNELVPNVYIDCDKLECSCCNFCCNVNGKCKGSHNIFMLGGGG